MTDPTSSPGAPAPGGAFARTDRDVMYSGVLSFCRLPYATTLAGADLAVLGVPFDTAVSNRPGTRFGPRAIRQASVNLAWSHCWPSPFDPFERLAVVDWGDVAADYGRPETVPGAIEAAIGEILDAGAMALALGGDHFVSYPCLKAHAARQGGGLSLIHFDAHCDTSVDDGRIDHGTMFHHAVREGIVDPARSIQIGIRTTYPPTGFTVWDANRVHGEGLDATVAKIREVVGDNRCYLTFDIDCLDPAFAPGTGTPVCGGLTSWQGKELIRRLDGIRLVGMDVVEVSPPYDHAEITALAGATIALELICLAARLGGRP